ncbi:Hsp70 family protein [Streptomyces sp. HB132]|uniref:Hsp70 family protein n=1 Tax=Streptomyces sp. HB132 TaxID=767388 RepID=UPI001E182272|nr:Hsp70 family protein [Streptomyces sp. HB132]MBM7440952.1 hypothetical protein [Streptomyces sp. HB132]
MERSKILLSTQPSVHVITPDGIAVEIHQAELEDAIADLVDRALAPVEQCLDDLHMAPLDVDDILMIGGTSQIPSVRAAVAEALQMEPVPTELCDPMTAVARGASIAAAVLAGETEGVIQVATSHALGTVVKDSSGRKKFSEIIPRNSPLPWKERKSYTPQRDHARKLSVEIWEGDPDKELTHPDNVQLTELSLTYPTPRARDEASFGLEYMYDSNGLLHVKAVLEHTGEVVLDEEVKSFGSGGPTPEVRRELDDLLQTNPTPAAPMAAPAHPRPVPTPPSGQPAAGDSPHTLVVDGSNLAWIGRSPRRSGVSEEDDRPSFGQLQAARAALAKKYPSAEIHVVVDASLRHKVAESERQTVTAAISKGDVIQPPAGTEGKGDALVAAIADESGAMIVTNDNFVELQGRYPWLREKGRVLGATCAKDVWIFTDRTCVAPRTRA